MSDNASEFATGQLKSWLNAMSFRLVHSHEYRSSSNGLAGRMVTKGAQGLTEVLQFVQVLYLNDFSQVVLFVHRNSAVRKGKTPAELILSYSVRHLILPHVFSQDLWYKPNSSYSAVPSSSFSEKE